MMRIPDAYSSISYPTRRETGRRRGLLRHAVRTENVRCVAPVLAALGVTTNKEGER